MKIFICILLITILYKVKFYGKDEYNQTPLSQENVIPIRGILAFEIVLGHLYGLFDELNCFYLNNRIGVWVVALFMFFSGYGLMKSKCSKPDYMKSFLIKRIGNILFPVLVSFVFAVLFNFSNSLVSYVLYDWFVVEITFLYLAWFILYQYLPQKYAAFILGAAICLLNFAGVYYDIGSRWYGSTACFLVGILFEKYEVKIREYFMGKYFLRGGFVFLLWACFTFLFLNFSDHAFISMVLINVTAILLCFLMYCFLMKIKSFNTILRFGGIISWDIYVSHRIVINLFGSMQPSNVFLWMMFFSICIVGFGVLVWAICNGTLKGIKHIGKK